MSHPARVKLSLELAPPFDVCAGMDASALPTCGIRHAVNGLLGELGLPAEADVEFLPLAAAAGPARRLRLRVEGHECYYPRELSHAVYSFLVREPLGDGLPAQFERWIAQASAAAENAADYCRWVEWMVREALALQCGVLFTPAVCAAYLELLRPYEWPPAGCAVEEAKVASALRWVLDQRTSLADCATVAAFLSAADSGMSAQEIAEFLYPPLRPAAFEILLEPGYLRTIACEQTERNVFVQLRSALDEKWGLSVPALRLLGSPGVPPGCVQFRLNHLATLPRLGLPPGTRLITDSAGDAASSAEDGVSPADDGESPWQDPVSGAPCRLVARTADEAPPGTGTTWTPLDYVAALLLDEVELHAALLVDRQTLETTLGAIDDWFPTLVGAFRARYSTAQATALVRGLARERVTIKDLRTILGSAVDYDTITVDPRLHAFDERLPWPVRPEQTKPAVEQLVSHVRRRLWARFAATLPVYGDRLYVYQTSPRVEALLLEAVLAFQREEAEGALVDFPARFDGRRREQLLARLRALTVAEGRFSPTTPLLTTGAVRPYLRRLIEHEFPRAIVIARQELPAPLDVVVLAQIDFDADDVRAS